MQRISAPFQSPRRQLVDGAVAVPLPARVGRAGPRARQRRPCPGTVGVHRRGHVEGRERHGPRRLRRWPTGRRRRPPSGSTTRPTITGDTATQRISRRHGDAASHRHPIRGEGAALQGTRQRARRGVVAGRQAARDSPRARRRHTADAFPTTTLHVWDAERKAWPRSSCAADRDRAQLEPRMARRTAARSSLRCATPSSIARRGSGSRR